MLTLSRVILFGAPALFIVLSMPLMLRLVPPNRFYGYRTAWSLASPENWYQANFLSGLALTGASILMLGIGFWIETWRPDWTDMTRLLVAVLLQGSIVSLTLLAVVLKIEGQIG